MPTIKILLVEDEPGHAELIRLAFEDWPMDVDVRHVRTLGEARRCLGAAIPDLLIVDLNLPDGRGTDLLGSKESPLAFPAIILTSVRDQVVTVEAIKCGALDFVIKSSEAFRRMPLAVERALREWRALTERSAAMEAARERERMLELTLERVLDGVITLDETGRIERANPSIERMFGHPVGSLVGRSIEVLVATGGRPITTHGQVVTEAIGTRLDGSSFPLEFGVNQATLGGRRLSIITLRDLSRSKRVEQYLSYLADYDQLTGLPNRCRFSRELERALSLARGSTQSGALFLVDLDGFKLVNDTLGHACGDKLLIAVADRLREVLRDGDIVARLGGDEFAILLSDVAGEEALSRIADKVHRKVAEPHLLDGSEAFVTASIGIAPYPAAGSEESVLMKHADLALYRAKSGGRAMHCFFTDDLNATVRQRQTIQARLRRAIENEGLALHYQPILNVETGAVFAVEALLRWRDDELGVVSPDLFIPIAEETSLIVPLGEWVLETAVRQVQAWQGRSAPAFPISLNLSSRQFMRPDTRSTQQLLKLAAQYARAGLLFEVTETSLMDDLTLASRFLEQLKAAGARIAIDDFGTGFSALGYLTRLPVDCLKIDRSFVQTMLEDADQSAVTRAVIAMGLSLDLDVIAEGVESAAQAAHLQGLGCHLMQGFHFARPAPAADFEAALFGCDNRVAKAAA